MKVKYINRNDKLHEDLVTADKDAWLLANKAIDKFGEEKDKGYGLSDVKDGTILGEENKAINSFNKNPENHQHVDLYGNDKHDTIMAQFVNQDGVVANEICSSDTPEEEKPVRDQYYDEFAHLGVTRAQSEALSSNSSSTEEEELPKTGSRKRKHEDNDSDSDQGPSHRRVTEDMFDDNISSIYELAGDD